MKRPACSILLKRKEVVYNRKYNMRCFKMMKYNHYGVEVIYQVISKDFREVLRENNINYIDLPVLENVVKYIKEDVTRYAYIVPCEMEDNLISVYITEEILIDMNWKILALDIRNQIDGKPAMNPETKCHLLCRTVEEIYNEEIKCDSDDLFTCLCDREDITPLEFRLILGNLGYEVEDLLQMDCSEVDVDKLKEMR